MRKQYSQITFEFQDPPDSGENAGVGVRIKALKKAADEKVEQLPDEDQLSDESTDTVAGRHEQYPHATLSQSPAEDNISDELSQKENFSGKLSAPENSSGDTSEDHTEEAIDLQFSTRNSAVILPEDITDLSNETVTTDDEHAEANASVLKTTKSTRGRKSLKTIDDGTELINIPPDEELFKKQYYAIGEVAEMFHVNQSLLRFWETEFDIIQPRKNRKGDRHFRPIDIKNLLLIHDLLRRRKLTIEGAKDFLKKNKRTPERFAMIQSLQKIKGFILEVKATL